MSKTPVKVPMKIAMKVPAKVPAKSIGGKVLPFKPPAKQATKAPQSDEALRSTLIDRGIAAEFPADHWDEE